MTTPLRGGLRLVRSAGVAAVVLSVAAAAHVTGHGSLPHPAILLVLGVAVALASTAVTRRRLELPGLLALMITAQVLVHQLLSWLAVPGCGVVVAPAGAHAAHPAAAGDVLLCATPAGDSELQALGATSTTMVLAHLGATLVATAVVASAEQALWALLEWLRPALRPAAPPALLVPDRAEPGFAGIRRLPYASPTLRSVRRRGPPVALSTATA